MAFPIRQITNGPGLRDLELTFIARHLGARAKFTIFVDSIPLEVEFRIFNFEFTSATGIYKLGGQLPGISYDDKKKLPAYNWIFVVYDATERRGQMEFSNAE